MGQTMNVSIIAKDVPTQARQQQKAILCSASFEERHAAGHRRPPRELNHRRSLGAPSHRRPPRTRPPQAQDTGRISAIASHNAQPAAAGNTAKPAIAGDTSIVANGECEGTFGPSGSLLRAQQLWRCWRSSHAHALGMSEMSSLMRLQLGESSIGMQ